MSGANPKSVVALNEPEQALEIFKQELMPAIKDVRGELVACDLGDYVHIVLNHAENGCKGSLDCGNASQPRANSPTQDFPKLRGLH